MDIETRGKECIRTTCKKNCFIVGITPFLRPYIFQIIFYSEREYGNPSILRRHVLRKSDLFQASCCNHTDSPDNARIALCSYPQLPSRPLPHPPVLRADRAHAGIILAPWHGMVALLIVVVLAIGNAPVVAVDPSERDRTASISKDSWPNRVPSHPRNAAMASPHLPPRRPVEPVTPKRCGQPPRMKPTIAVVTAAAAAALAAAVAAAAAAARDDPRHHCAHHREAEQQQRPDGHAARRTNAKRQRAKATEPVASRASCAL